MSLPDPSTFVAGATGYLGRALVSNLAGRGVRVRAHLRPGSPHTAVAEEAFVEAGAEVAQSELSALDLRDLAPTHFFFAADGGDEHLSLVRSALQVCASLEKQPRFVYVSSLGASSRSLVAYLRTRAEAEDLISASNLPFTIARPGVIHGPGRGERRPGEALLAGVLRLWSGAARLAGARQHARRYRPTCGHELAHGLVHAAFNYTTIGRVLEAEELRYDQANTDEHHLPATRRDHRH